ncbi:TPA: hypothetical protein ACMU2U_001417 [Clostridioides difficile]|nr:hypothetical protein [Clostridioides difficile]MCI4304773.1 hypothetical protein [Clostridioides difficile]MCM4101577.1 hypothetical protein [Clostridioides difficile]HBG2405023.1 hypothetical protein [Clostridioides difficile]HDF4164007.1 hypothetical protein [Clostridioides difficile]
MKKIISRRKKEFLSEGIIGILLICCGLFEIQKKSSNISIDYNNNIFIIVAIAISILLLAKIIINVFFKVENEDELSELNKLKARSDTLLIIQLILTICLFITAFKNSLGLDIDLVILIPFLCGGTCLSNFLLFIFHERVGE